MLVCSCKVGMTRVHFEYFFQLCVENFHAIPDLAFWSFVVGLTCLLEKNKHSSVLWRNNAIQKPELEWCAP